MKRRLAILFFLFFLLICGAKTGSATTISGSLTTPGSAGVTGTLYLSLSQQASQLSGGGCGGPFVIVPTIPVVITVTVGVVPSTNIVGNDCLAPANTYYIAIFKDTNGNTVFNVNWQITGSTENVGAIVPLIVPAGTASIGTAYVTNLYISGICVINGSACASASGSAANSLLFGGTNIALSTSAPSAGQCLEYNGSQIVGGTCGFGGSTTATHLTFSSATNTLGDVLGSAVTAGTGAIILTAGADTTIPFEINSHSGTQSAAEVVINNQNSGSSSAPLVVEGNGYGGFGPGGCCGSLAAIIINSNTGANNAWPLFVGNRTAGLQAAVGLSVTDLGVGYVFGGGATGDGSGNFAAIHFDENQSIYGAANQPGSVAILAAMAADGQAGFTVYRPLGVAGPGAGNMFQIAVGTLGFPLAGFDSGGVPGTQANVNLFLAGMTSGIAKIGVANVAGSPCRFVLPTSSASAGQFLSSAAPSGGDCQTSWSAPTLSMASGSGSGSNYTGTNTSYAAVDTTNVCATVTVPVGWKLDILAKGNIAVSTGAVTVATAISDVGATCTTGGTTPLDEEQFTPPVAGVFNESFTHSYVITGDGAAHSVALLAKTSNAADAWIIDNATASLTTRIRLLLIPSN